MNSRNFNDQFNEQANYDEYNRNNDLVNNIRLNNRYSVDDYNNSIQTNGNINTNINPSVSMNFNNSTNQMNNGNAMNTLNSRNFNNNLNNNNVNNNMSNNNMNNNYNNTNNNMNNMNNNLNNSNALNTNPNNMNRSQDINIDLNEYVREGLESRGLHVRTQSPRSIKMAEMERKKSLLNNIQTQINLTKRTKLEELKKRQEEDAQYLKDMVVCYPFGRGGGGAPNRDKSGNVIANRRALISDPKYNFASINVDDDYNEVWGREKRIGRFYRNSSEFLNTNNNINNNLQNNETAPNTASYNNNNFVSNNYDNNNNNDFYNQPVSNNRPYSTNPQQMNNQDNNNFNNYSQNIPRRYEINFNTYNNDLLYKMKEEENRKLLELKQRQLETERENERILKEIEDIDKEQNEIKLRNSIREQNKLLRSYQNLNNNNKIGNVTNDETTIETNNIYRTNIIEKDVIDPDSVVLDKNAIDKINKSEQESRNRLNNEISRLRDLMHNQQLSLFQQIANLRNEAEQANNQREEALKEIEKLKAQIKQSNEDELKKKYVHHIIITEDGNKNNQTSSTQTESNPPPKKEEDPLELNKLLKQNIDRLKYLEELEKLNAIRKSPPTDHQYEYQKVITEKEEDDDDDLYEIEITKIHNQ